MYELMNWLTDFVSLILFLIESVFLKFLNNSIKWLIQWLTLKNSIALLNESVFRMHQVNEWFKWLSHKNSDLLPLKNLPN